MFSFLTVISSPVYICHFITDLLFTFLCRVPTKIICDDYSYSDKSLTVLGGASLSLCIHFFKEKTANGYNGSYVCVLCCSAITVTYSTCTFTFGCISMHALITYIQEELWLYSAAQSPEYSRAIHTYSPPLLHPMRHTMLESAL